MAAREISTPGTSQARARRTRDGCSMQEAAKRLLTENERRLAAILESILSDLPRCP